MLYTNCLAVAERLKVLNDLRDLRKLGSMKKVSKTLYNYSLVLSPPRKITVLSILAKKYGKTEIELSPLFSNIFSVIVDQFYCLLFELKQ